MSIKVKSALSIYGKYGAKAAGKKKIEDLTVEDLIHGIVVGVQELNRGVEGAAIPDRVLCYRSSFDNEVNFQYVTGEAAAAATLGSKNCLDARLLYRNGQLTGDVPRYLRDALSEAIQAQHAAQRSSRREALREAIHPPEESQHAAQRSSRQRRVRLSGLAGALGVHWMVMPFQHYSDFEGYASRREYWMWMLFQALVGLAFLGLFLALGIPLAANDIAAETGWLVVALTALWGSVWFPAGAEWPIVILPRPEIAVAMGVPEGLIIGMMFLVGLYGLATMVPHWAVSHRRLHDAGQSGGWFWAPLVAMLGGAGFMALIGSDSVILRVLVLLPAGALLIVLLYFLTRR